LAASRRYSHPRFGCALDLAMRAAWWLARPCGSPVSMWAWLTGSALIQTSMCEKWWWSWESPGDTRATFVLIRLQYRPPKALLAIGSSIFHLDRLARHRSIKGPSCDRKSQRT